MRTDIEMAKKAQNHVRQEIRLDSPDAIGSVPISEATEQHGE
jgi:hypothetical protein